MTRRKSGNGEGGARFESRVGDSLTPETQASNVLKEGLVKPEVVTQFNEVVERMHEKAKGTPTANGAVEFEVVLWRSTQGTFQSPLVAAAINKAILKLGNGRKWFTRRALLVETLENWCGPGCEVVFSEFNGGGQSLTAKFRIDQ